MPVPDTNTFSLQDVVDEVSPSSDNLSTCISEANTAYWDTTHATLPASKLSDFRNYGPFEPCSEKFAFSPNSVQTLGYSDFWASSGPIPDMIKITRIDVDSFGGASSSNYIRYNGTDLLLNQDINFEVSLSGFTLDAFIASGPNGTCTSTGTYTLQIHYGVKYNGERYGHCITGRVNACG